MKYKRKKLLLHSDCRMLLLCHSKCVSFELHNCNIRKNVMIIHTLANSLLFMA